MILIFHPTKVLELVGGEKQKIFTGLLDEEGYIEIIRKSLLPLCIQMVIICSKTVTQSIHEKFFKDEGINWWKTPAESPDCNPNENVWHKLTVHSQGSEANKPERIS